MSTTIYTHVRRRISSASVTVSRHRNATEEGFLLGAGGGGHRRTRAEAVALPKRRDVIFAAAEATDARAPRPSPSQSVATSSGKSPLRRRTDGAGGHEPKREGNKKGNHEQHRSEKEMRKRSKARTAGERPTDLRTHQKQRLT